MVSTPALPANTNVDNLTAPTLGDVVTDQTVGRSYKRLKLAEVANQLQRASSADLGKEVVHHHSVVNSSDTRPGWVDAFKEELKRELKQELKDPIMTRFALESNRRTRSANKVVVEKGMHAVLLEVTKAGGPLEIGQTPSLEDLGLDNDFLLSRDAILGLTSQQLDQIYAVYLEESCRALPGRTTQDRRNAFMHFLCDV